MTFYNIPADLPFLESFAASLLEETQEAPEKLSDILVFLPTRRACKKLQEKFLQLTQGAPLLLPEMRPLGDMDEEELFFQDHTATAPALEIPSAISSDERIIQLASLIQKDPNIKKTDIAIELAKELARFLDEALIENVNYDGLENLVPEDYAEHWQKTLSFLEIITHHWPLILQSQGLIDAVSRRNLLLQAQANIWKEHPPQKKIICAGITGSIPAVRDLLVTIADLPNGHVILPALDPFLSEEEWCLLEPTHPQYMYQKILQDKDINLAEIKEWPVPSAYKTQYARPDRQRFLSELMRPALLTEKWRDLTADSFTPETLSGLNYLVAETGEHEALMVSLLLRETLEIPEKTAALITPDRQLASRVKAIMKRWDIDINDSAGTPLRATAVGTYLRLVAQTVAQNFSPIKLLELLKHPLCAAGMPRNDFIVATRALEKFLLRGPRPTPGLNGLFEVLEQKISAKDPHNKQETFTEEKYAIIRTLITKLAEATEGFGEFSTKNTRSLKQWIYRHGKVAEALAATDIQSGSDRLWRQEDGEASALLFANLIDLSDLLQDIPLTDYPAIFESLIAGKTVRPKFGMHPRLFILGPLEARLLHHDVTILGGFNEGVWPQQTETDSWMSRPMREKFGLPSPEQTVGIMAHDVVQLLSGEDVWITRSLRVDGTPQVPSRWLLRLQTILEATNLSAHFLPNTYYPQFAEYLDKADSHTPISRPSPCPPVEARPTKMSITRIETWKKDPYSIYASQILNLYKLDPLDAQAGVSEKGQFIHDALEDFVREYDIILPQDRYERLLEIGREKFGKWLQQPEIKGFWWPRFERIAAFFINWEHQKRIWATPLYLETKGEMQLLVDGLPFTLYGRADRIDLKKDGTAEIIDYKTGTVPSKNEVKSGLAPQLVLEALILQAKGFENQRQSYKTSALSYLKLTGGREAGLETSLTDDQKDTDISLLLQEAEEGLKKLIREFRHPESCYLALPKPKLAPRYNDYKHLERVAEWGDLND